MNASSIPQYLFDAACDSIVMPPEPSYYKEIRNTLFSKEFAPKIKLAEQDYTSFMGENANLTTELETALNSEEKEINLAKIGRKYNFKMPFFIAINLVEI